MILQSETVKLNVTKSYILVDVVAVLALVLPAFYGLSMIMDYYDIMDFLYYHEL